MDSSLVHSHRGYLDSESTISEEGIPNLGKGSLLNLGSFTTPEVDLVRGGCGSLFFNNL